jgi:hypothetical protein
MQSTNRINNLEFYTLPHLIYVFCTYLRTNSDVCFLQHKLIGFYSRNEKCLLSGTNWAFKHSSLRFVFKGLMTFSFITFFDILLFIFFIILYVFLLLCIFHVIPSTLFSLACRTVDSNNKMTAFT